MVPVTHRWAAKPDMPILALIERECFQAPCWTEQDFQKYMTQANHVLLVFREHQPDGELIAGYLAYALQKGFLDLINLGVHPTYRRQKVGKQMIDFMVKKLHSHHRTRVRAQVRETNLAAQLFLRAMGFKAINIRRRFFEDTREDAFVMQYVMPGVVLDPDDEPAVAACEED